jgi:hypothetical protein
MTTQQQKQYDDTGKLALWVKVSKSGNTYLGGQGNDLSGNKVYVSEFVNRKLDEHPDLLADLIAILAEAQEVCGNQPLFRGMLNEPDVNADTQQPVAQAPRRTRTNVQSKTTQEEEYE